MMEFLKQAKKLEIFIIVAIIAVLGIVYALTKEPVRAPTVENQESQQQVPASTISYRGADGRNALELLKSHHQVETQEFSGLGEFVISIDGIAPDSQHFWAFYVDGKQAQVGASAYVTKDGEQIEWKLEKIEY